MPTRSLDKSQRKGYFDRVSRELGASLAEIEVAGLGLGVQLARAWTPLRGIAYDPRADAVEIVTDDLDHMISHPREIFVEDGVEGLRSVQIIDAEGNHQIVRLKRPLLLESAATSRRRQ